MSDSGTRSTGEIPADQLLGCSTCGLAQRIPRLARGEEAHCRRCGSRLSLRIAPDLLRSRTAALATAALILYPCAVLLPILEIRQFGRATETGVVEAIARLFADSRPVLGLVILVCSVVLPLFKLFALLLLSRRGSRLDLGHQALVHRLVEWTGRFGMLDVLCVAVLVAALKLGDLMTVRAGPAALAFLACVVLSLLASASFDPRALWSEEKA